MSVPPKDVAIVTALSGFYAICRLLYLPGLAAGLAVKNFNNPVFYADRFALPWLYPTDPWASYQRDVYPLLSLVLAVPAMLWKFLQVPPIYPTWVIVALNDLLIVLAVYWLSRALSFDRFVSVAAGIFALVSQALSWSLAGYIYLGHDNGYAGSFVIPFAIGVIPSLIQRRVGTALVLAATGNADLPAVGGDVSRGDRLLARAAGRAPALEARSAVSAVATGGACRGDCRPGHRRRQRDPGVARRGPCRGDGERALRPAVDAGPPAGIDVSRLFHVDAAERRGAPRDGSR